MGIQHTRNKYVLNYSLLLRVLAEFRSQGQEKNMVLFQMNNLKVLSSRQLEGHVWAPG